VCFLYMLPHAVLCGTAGRLGCKQRCGELPRDGVGDRCDDVQPSWLNLKVDPTNGACDLTPFELQSLGRNILPLDAPIPWKCRVEERLRYVMML
jgi:hypothetical protein